MKFEPRVIDLRTGQKCVLCPNCSLYAAEMIDYLKVTAGETDFLLRYPDEVTFTAEGEGTFLDSILNSDRSLMMAAVVDGQIAGNGSIDPVGIQRRISHRCSLAIALKKQYWGLGIGSAMMSYMLELAKNAGYERVELGVIEGNEQARALYRKFSFEETGRIRLAMRYDDGTCRDEILMSRPL